MIKFFVSNSVNIEFYQHFILEIYDKYKYGAAVYWRSGIYS